MGVMSPTADEATVPSVVKTHLGKTAQQWHARAVWRTKQRNKLRGEVREMQQAIRERVTAVGSHPLESSFMCIHAYEGAWNDPSAPYYGGMQMDLSFQRAYGREFLNAWGTADHWPVSVQLAVAMRAYLSGRGFYPWPNTARYCNLIS
jgi:hypothetical protein